MLLSAPIASIAVLFTYFLYGIALCLAFRRLDRIVRAVDMGTYRVMDRATRKQSYAMFVWYKVTYNSVKDFLFLHDFKTTNESVFRVLDL